LSSDSSETSFFAKKHNGFLLKKASLFEEFYNLKQNENLLILIILIFYAFKSFTFVVSAIPLLIMLPSTGFL
jgi:hypothetical protein